MAVVSVSTMFAVIASAIPVKHRYPKTPKSTYSDAPAATGMTKIGTSVPTVGALALLYSLTYRAPAAELLIAIRYNTPPDDLMLVEFVDAALLMLLADGLMGLT